MDASIEPVESFLEQQGDYACHTQVELSVVCDYMIGAATGYRGDGYK